MCRNLHLTTFSFYDTIPFMNKQQLRTARFWQRVVKANGCWLWTGPPNNSGYGSAVSPITGKVTSAHRISYELLIRIIPTGLLACHKCDNRLCVNPSHLFIGTQKDNVDDCRRKGRFATGCKLNHPCQKGELNYGAKLTLHKARLIRVMHSCGVSQREIARQLDIPFGNVWNVLHNRSWIESTLHRE